MTHIIVIVFFFFFLFWNSIILLTNIIWMKGNCIALMGKRIALFSRSGSVPLILPSHHIIHTTVSGLSYRIVYIFSFITEYLFHWLVGELESDGIDGACFEYNISTFYHAIFKNVIFLYSIYTQQKFFHFKILYILWKSQTVV